MYVVRGDTQLLCDCMGYTLGSTCGRTIKYSNFFIVLFFNFSRCKVTTFGELPKYLIIGILWSSDTQFVWNNKEKETNFYKNTSLIGNQIGLSYPQPLSSKQLYLRSLSYIANATSHNTTGHGGGEEQTQHTGKYYSPPLCFA